MGFDRTIWKHPPAGKMRLPEHTVDVWLIPLQHPETRMCQLEAVLSRDETASAKRLLSQRLSDRFIVRRARLRAILSVYTGQSPSDIQYRVGDYGKPSMNDGSLAFNLSHAGDFAICAVWNGRSIGVDIEHHRAMLDLFSIATNYFSDEEQAELITLPESQREQAFYNCWTRKEAVIKANGRGLQIPLESFSVTPLRNEAVTVHLTDMDQPLYVRMLPVPPKYTGAIAVERSLFTVRCWLDDLDIVL